MNRPLVSVVAPMYNEAAAIEEFIERVTLATSGVLQNYEFEVVIVDDSSRDCSRDIVRKLICKEPRLRLIELSRRFGQTQAIQAGVDAANGSIVVTLDSDLQHAPEDIPRFLKKLDEGYDMVCGWRRQRSEGRCRRWPSAAANFFIRAISGLPIHDFGTTFRACRMDLAKDIRLLGEFHRFIPALGYDLGARITEIPIEDAGRSGGRSKYGLSRTFGVALDLLLLYFFTHYMDRPMRAFGKVAFATFSAGAAIVVWLIIYAYSRSFRSVQEHSGWFLIGLVLIITSVQVLMAGIIAEILVRLHYGTGGHRFYRVRRTTGADQIK